MKTFCIMATGGEYCLTPCAIIKASDDKAALALVKEYNPMAAKKYMLVAEPEEYIEDVELWKYQGALDCETPEDLKDAF